MPNTMKEDAPGDYNRHLCRINTTVESEDRSFLYHLARRNRTTASHELRLILREHRQRYGFVPPEKTK